MWLQVHGFSLCPFFSPAHEVCYYIAHLQVVYVSPNFSSGVVLVLGGVCLVIGLFVIGLFSFCFLLGFFLHFDGGGICFYVLCVVGVLSG
jgi:hypothetical protein